MEKNNSGRHITGIEWKGFEDIHHTDGELVDESRLVEIDESC